MKKILVMVMCAVMCCLMLVGCGDSKYVGTWKAEFMGESMEIELKKDHKAVFEGDEANWKVKDKKIVLSDPSGKNSETLDFEIKDDKTIAFTMEGISLEFKKQ